MARIVCDQCGEITGTRASVCPGCGIKPRPYRRRLNLFLCVAIAAVAVYVVAISAFFAQGVLLVQ